MTKLIKQKSSMTTMQRIRFIKTEKQNASSTFQNRTRKLHTSLVDDGKPNYRCRYYPQLDSHSPQHERSLYNEVIVL